jgi:centromeric protein E
MPPPPTVVVARTMENSHHSDGEIGTRHTHIEVCCRIRPLSIGKESSASFFEKKTARNRKAQIPRTPLRGGSARRLAISTPDPQRDTIPLVDPFYAWDVGSDDTVRQSSRTELVQGRTHQYTLDRVYGPATTTHDLYQQSVRDRVHAAMDGFHAAVLAYGQTSTGKTHTMSGTSVQPGLIPLCIQECFAYLQAQNTPREYLLRVSYLEVYKEHIRDLLATSATAPPVRLFDSVDGLIIKGLREEVVTTPSQVFQVLQKGEARRQVGATHLNQHSSRSHVMVRLWIESRGMHEKNGSSGNAPTTPTRCLTPLSSQSSLSSLAGRGPVRVSSLSLVDLAGSESVRLTGSTERRQEGHYINKSLMTLGKVVYALSEGIHSHVPYRDSKLTRLLQPSLAGNAQVVLVCCISPLASHLEESHNTFKFANRAKKIPQKATIQETLDEKTLLQSYREEIEDLKQQLNEARQTKARVSTQPDSVAATTSSVSSADAAEAENEILELMDAIQTMEKLILKSQPVRAPEDLLDTTDSTDFDDAEDDERLFSFVSDANSVPSTPTQTGSSPSKGVPLEKDMHVELSRIQSLLGSVLKKRRDLAKTLPQEEEVKHLRAQLERQEMTTSLRKADSSFLQQQLEEKDDLLREVSKVLEAVEERQQELEAENAMLRRQLVELRARTNR